MTKEEAIELSIFKWELIVEYNGLSLGNVWYHPALANLKHSCGLCEKYRVGLDCGSCPFIIDGKRCTDTDHPWENWYENNSRENAKIVLDELKKLRK